MKKYIIKILGVIAVTSIVASSISIFLIGMISGAVDADLKLILIYTFVGGLGIAIVSSIAAFELD